MIQWIKIEENSELPFEKEVVAINQETQEIVIGYFEFDKNEKLICDDEVSYLEDPTHYILKENLTKSII